MSDKVSLPRTSPLPDLVPCPITLTSVRGLRAAGVRAGIKPSGRPDVALLCAERPMACAGLFTKNRFPAAPVTVSREHLRLSGGRVRAIVVNSGNANACTGVRGVEDAREMCAQVARGIGCAVEEVLVCSTGVIGQRLPMERVRAGISAALAELSDELEAGRRFLQAIMTTDAFPKESGERLDVGGREATVAGVCKGAGMIEPDMATLLCFLCMDLDVDVPALRAALPAIAEKSLNAVHVDSHGSTNDTLLLLSTGEVPLDPGLAQAEWQGAAARVARRLAWLVARDGEGATKVTTIRVTGARDDEAARQIARRVAASALVRTALFGNDPNWGRFVSQAGNCPGLLDASRLRCVLQGTTVFAQGEATAFDRAALSRAMAAEDVLLELALGDGDGHAEVLTSDLSYRYVEVNAEYTT